MPLILTNYTYYELYKKTQHTISPKGCQLISIQNKNVQEISIRAQFQCKLHQSRNGMTKKLINSGQFTIQALLNFFDNIFESTLINDMSFRNRRPKFNQKTLLDYCLEIT